MRGDATSLRVVVEEILSSYEQHGEMAHLAGGSLPTLEVVRTIVDDLLCLLFPGFLEGGLLPREDVSARTTARVEAVRSSLCSQVERGLRYRQTSLAQGEREVEAEQITLELLAAIPHVRDVLATDITAAYEGDPAAHSNEEIIVAYPGLQAIAVYRLAHVLYIADVPLVPRMMTEYAHARTGIDIHPGAKIGERFFIDHGTGVVIGETTTIGNNVRIYQGVTLGARSFQKDERGRVIKGIKRHPDIADDVTIYSGATILGGDVVIGRGSVIGGNVWLIRSVPPFTRIMVRPPQQVQLPTTADDYHI